MLSLIYRVDHVESSIIIIIEKIELAIVDAKDSS